MRERIFLVNSDEDFVMKRTAVDGEMHVTSLNVKTGTRSIVQLRMPEKVPSCV